MKYLKPIYLFPFFALYFILCGTMYLIQDRLLYFPDTNTSWQKDVWKSIPGKDHTLALETLDNHDKVIILFHGNVGNANMRSYYFNFFPKDYHLIVAEYPGFGINSDEEMNKNNIIKRAQQLMDKIKERKINDIIIVGESFGTAIASQMALDYNVKKLVLVTPFSTVSEVAQNRYWYLPVSTLLKDDYDNMSPLHDYKGKVLFFIAQNDHIIPPQFSMKLFDYIHTKKEKIIVNNAGHVDWLYHVTKNQVQELSDFIHTQ